MALSVFVPGITVFLLTTEWFYDISTSFMLKSQEETQGSFLCFSLALLASQNPDLQ